MGAGLDVQSMFLSTVAPAAGALGLEEEETSALLAVSSFLKKKARTGAASLRYVLEEAVKPDSKFAKNFEKSFDKSFTSAMEGKGALGMIDAFGMALREWGSTTFQTSFGSAEYGGMAEMLVNNRSRIEEIIGLTSNAEGTAERIVEQYSDSVKSAAGVLGGHFDAFKSDVGTLFADDAIGWMNTLSDILGDKDFINAVTSFADSARLLSDPLREVIKPMADLAATIVNFGGQNVVGEASLLDFLMLGAITTRYTRLGRSKGVMKPSAVSTGGIGGLGALLGGAGGKAARAGSVAAKTGKAAGAVAGYGLAGIAGYSVLSQMLSDEERQDLQQNAFAEEMHNLSQNALLRADTRKMMGGNLGMVSREVGWLQGGGFTQEHQMRSIGRLAQQLSADQLLYLLNNTGTSTSVLDMALTEGGLSDVENNQLRKVIELRDYREMLRTRADETPTPAAGTQVPQEPSIMDSWMGAELTRIRAAVEGTEHNTDPDNPANCPVVPAINTTYFQTDQRVSAAVF